MAKLEQFEMEVSGLRTETAKQAESLKDSLHDQSMLSERHGQEIEGINQTIVSVQRRFQDLEPIQSSLQKSQEEDQRINRSPLRNSIPASVRWKGLMRITAAPCG